MYIKYQSYYTAFTSIWARVFGCSSRSNGVRRKCADCSWQFRRNHRSARKKRNGRGKHFGKPRIFVRSRTGYTSDGRRDKRQRFNRLRKACCIFSSAFVIPFETSAEYPPIKLTPTFFAAASRVRAIVTKSSGVSHAEAPTSPIGVTDILLLTIGIPYSFSISCPVSTRLAATCVILLYIFLLSSSRLLSAQSRRLIPSVIVLTSRF